jgi:WD40 repeat protein
MRLQRSPDGNRFLAYHLRGGIAIYDARTGELLKGLQIPLMADERIESVTFGEDELLYLLRNSNGVQSVQEWNWKQNKSTSAEFEPSTVKSQFGGIQFLPKSNRLIAWGALNKIVIWNVGTGKIDVEFEPLTAQVTELLVTHDESAILIRVGFSRLLLWSLRQRMPITDYSIPPKTILRGIAISPDASHAAANATVDGIEQLLVWSTPTARLIESFPIAIRGYLQFAPDGNLLLGMLDERILGGVDLSRKKPIPLAYLPVRMKNFLVHPTENFLVSNDTDQSVRFWKLLPPEPLMTAMPKKEKLPENEGLLKTSEALRNDINHMQFTQDGKKLIAGTKDGFIYTLDAMTLKDLDGFQATQGTLLDMALTPKVTQGATMIPERVVTLGDDRKIRLWDLEDSKQLLELPSDRFYTKRPRLNLYVTPDGSTIIAHDLNKFRGYDARTGRELVVTPNSRGALQEISFSPLSKLAMTIGADKQVSILDPKTWKELRFVNVAMDLRGLQYCAESKSIVGYVRDGVYVIEDKPKGVVLHRFDHLNDVRDLVVVPGKPWVVSLSRTTRTSELRLWDIKSGNRLATYETRGRPSKIAISNDGLRIAVNDQNATVSIFGLPVKEEKK